MSSRRFSAISLVGLLGLSSMLHAQEPKLSRLEEVLQQLEANLNRYDTGVPSFFCEEHILSSNQAPGLRDQDTVTDSIFRLKRTPNPDHTTTLIESRDILQVDGKPATKQQIKVPSLLEGAFEGGLAVGSATQAACMKYSLQSAHKNHPEEPYIVRFAMVLTPQNTSNCLLQENSQGRTFIDHASMQVTRLELTTPHHTIIPSSSYEPAVIGERVIAVDYAPVRLDNETFWLPATINLRATSGAGTFHKEVWSFRATYRNCHRLKVSSRIVPDSVTVVP